MSYFVKEISREEYLEDEFRKLKIENALLIKKIKSLKEKNTSLKEKLSQLNFEDPNEKIYCNTCQEKKLRKYTEVCDSCDKIKCWDCCHVLISCSFCQEGRYDS